MSADASDVRVRLYSPIPPMRENGHGGFKLDRRSDVGRTGALLEWQPIGRGVDAGVPVEVTRMLAEALCAVATVTGCTLHLPRELGEDWTSLPEGHARLFRGPWWRGANHDVGLLATRDPDVVARAFEDDTFAWWNEGQVIFLSPPDVLPRLDRTLVLACFDLPIRATLSELAATGVVGLLRAGVDGDVAGLYVIEPAWREPIVHALADAVRADGGTWEEHDGLEHPALRTVGIDPAVHR